MASQCLAVKNHIDVFYICWLTSCEKSLWLGGSFLRCKNLYFYPQPSYFPTHPGKLIPIT